jgi:nucleotide-binding universal stress UspA family protein
MKKRLLIATDFSGNAKNAMRYAMELFADIPCEFYILNTYNVEPFTMEMNALRGLDDAQKASVNKLTDLLAKLKTSRLSDVHQFHIISECGTLVDIVKHLVDKHDIDMVVMGTKGGTDSRTEIYGSQTVLVIEQVRSCPVMAIPKNAHFDGLKTIVFPTGYRTPYKRREFQYLVDIAKRTNASIRVFHVDEHNLGLNRDQREKQDHLKSYFEGLDYTFHSVHSDDVPSAIDNYIAEQNADMVVFINKKHSFFRWMLKKPMVKHLTYHSQIPILALHDLSNL